MQQNNGTMNLLTDCKTEQKKLDNFVRVHRIEKEFMGCIELNFVQIFLGRLTKIANTTEMPNKLDCAGKKRCASHNTNEVCQLCIIDIHKFYYFPEFYLTHR